MKALASATLIIKKYWYLFTLALIAVLSFGLNFYAISEIGFGNAYYAAAIKSMSQSFHNFFYVSFDPAGMVSVDKPPLALWIQTIFVLIFGFHGWAMLLPQALAGTGSCIMMYVLTSKHFGRPAGLISALVVALTPAVVVVSRNNTMDMQLVFFLLVATWFLFKAIEKTKSWYVFLCALFMGLAFNVKMLQAFMILPAIVLVYLIFSKKKVLKRIINAVVSLVILVVVSFAWVIAVDLTPTSKRPYVDSSTNNTVMELIIGHNGMERLYGQGVGGGNRASGNIFNWKKSSMPDGANHPPSMPNNQGGNGVAPSDGTAPTDGAAPTDGKNPTHGNRTMPQGGFQNGAGFGGDQRGGQGGVAGNEIGTAGVLRLWSSSLYGQASWLIVFALFCIVANLRRFSFKNTTTKQSVFAYWGIWLATMCVFFSFAGFYHRYYLCMFAPGLAGIIGPGFIEMLKSFKEKQKFKQYLLPISLISTSIVEVIYVMNYSQLRSWLAPIMIVFAFFSIVLMGVYYTKSKRFIANIASVCILISLLVAPLYWSLTVSMYPSQNSTMPYAGPELASTKEIKGMTPNQENLKDGDENTNSLEKYLVANYKSGSFLVISQRANDVAQFIVDTGLPAVAYGGFLGSDNSMTVDQLKELVAAGKVTYFLVSNGGGSSNSEMNAYVESNATLISPSEYQSTSTDANANGYRGGSNSSLYLFK